jgi:hypothetical protein
MGRSYPRAFSVSVNDVPHGHSCRAGEPGQSRAPNGQASGPSGWAQQVLESLELKQMGTTKTYSVNTGRNLGHFHRGLSGTTATGQDLPMAGSQVACSPESL